MSTLSRLQKGIQFLTISHLPFTIEHLLIQQLFTEHILFSSPCAILHAGDIMVKRTDMGPGPHLPLEHRGRKADSQPLNESYEETYHLVHSQPEL